MNPKTGFLKSDHSPDEYLAKLVEELGEVAQAHAAVRGQLESLLRRAEKNPKVLKRPVPQSAVRASRHLDDELSDVIKVAEAWRRALRRAQPQSGKEKQS